MASSGYGLIAACAVLACALASAGQQHKPTRRAPAPKPAAELPEAAAQASALTGAIRENNLGVALMTHREFEAALGKFQTACIMNPQSDTGCLNAGIALLNMQRYDDALRLLAKSAERDPRNPGAWFNLALAEQSTGRTYAALEDFQQVAALDPDDAATQYVIGQLHFQAGQYDRAAAAFQAALRLDPLHPSAEAGWAQAAEKLGDSAAAKIHLERSRYLLEHRLGRPIRPAYGEQGKYSLAQEIVEPPAPAPPAIPVHFIDITAVSGLVPRPAPKAAASARTRAGKRGGSRTPPASASKPENAEPQTLASFLGSGACVFDYDGDGRPDIFLADADGKGHAALYRNLGHGKFADATKAAKLEFHGEGIGCAVADYDNDGHPDLAVGSTDGLALFHNEGHGTFQDVTDAAAIRSHGLVLGMTFIDYDGDGDLDLYVTRSSNSPLDNPEQPFSPPTEAAPGGNILWRSAGGGQFMDWTKEMGLGGDASSVAAIGTDLNNDRAIDLVVTGARKSPANFLNTREGPFRAVSPWEGDMPGPTAGAVALDFDRNGWMDLAFTHWAAPGLSLWRNVAGKSFERIPLADSGWVRGFGVAAVDYDNDGWIDLIAVGETAAGQGRMLLLRNEGPNDAGQIGFRDVTHETGLDKIVLRHPRCVVAFDFDGDGSPGLLITQNHLPPVLLKNVGGNKNHWLQLAATGDADSKTGIGTRIEILSGAQKQTGEIPGASGYLGQGPAEVHAGLGRESQADVVRLLWLTGVLQDEVELPAGARAVITEDDRTDSPH